jgi:hypothetical protein
MQKELSELIEKLPEYKLVAMQEQASKVAVEVWKALLLVELLKAVVDDERTIA